MSGISLPPLGGLLLTFVPQPVIFFGVKYGLGGAAGIAVLAMVLLAYFAGQELGLLYGLLAAIAGGILALLGRVRALESLVALVSTATFIGGAALAHYFFGSWGALVSDFRDGMTKQIASALKVQEQLGFPKESLDLMREQMPNIVEVTLQLLPGLLFLGTAFVVLINLLYLRRRFAERRADWFDLENLREWKGPEPLVWALIACGFAMFLPVPAPLRLIAINLLLVLGACYFAQGLAVVAFFFNKNNVPRFLRGITYILIVFQQIFTLMVVGLGLFDLWGDFRRLGKDKLTTTPAS